MSNDTECAEIERAFCGLCHNVSEESYTAVCLACNHRECEDCSRNSGGYFDKEDWDAEKGGYVKCDYDLCSLYAKGE